LESVLPSPVSLAAHKQEIQIWMATRQSTAAAAEKEKVLEPAGQGLGYYEPDFSENTPI